jgi:Abnormal spindle-like microcephaly-assoc'd, ASPM-SPD-2-Hydin
VGPARIDVEPVSCDCGDVEVGATGECTITLTNTGDGEVTILDGRFDDTSPQSPFRIRNFALPSTILAGGSLTLSVFCTPTDTTRVEAGITLEVDVCPGQVSIPVLVQGTN